MTLTVFISIIILVTIALIGRKLSTFRETIVMKIFAFAVLVSMIACSVNVGAAIVELTGSYAFGYLIATVMFIFIMSRFDNRKTAEKA
jgi:hypothetical protein